MAKAPPTPLDGQPGLKQEASPAYRCSTLLTDCADGEREGGQRAQQADDLGLAAMVAKAPMPMALLRGPQLVFEHVNEAYVQLIGGRATRGRTFCEVLHEFEAQEFAALLRHTLDTGEPYLEEDREVYHICRPGHPPERSLVSFAYHQVLDAGGLPYGVLVYVQDVTQKVEAREQLLACLRARDDFLAFSSHELKNPLAALQLSTQLLNRRLQRDLSVAELRLKVGKALADWQGALDRMLRLIDDMADFSRVNRGALTLQRTRCTLDKIVLEVLGRLAPQLEAHGVALTTRLVPASGDWDPARLDQLCTNLLSNAVKYGRGKPLLVEVTDLGSEVVLRVVDQGQGIAPIDLQRIFLPYERASTAHEDQSLGIGLFLAQRIVEAHGGTLRASSEVNVGTTFCVCLPRSAQAVAAT